MRNDLTDLTLVIDRSGSMSACKDDAQGGVNEFIKRQKEVPGDCNFTLVQFDTIYEFLHTAKPIREVSLDYVLHPRGGTALLDAVGRAIRETGERLSKMTEKDRPALVVFVIVTDGQENSSKEFTKAKVKEMIEHQQKNYNWKFSYLGANQDAFAEGGALGIAKGGIANYAEQKTGGGIKLAASLTARARGQAATGTAPDFAYSDEERKSIN
jgi:hypothetical protein